MTAKQHRVIFLLLFAIFLLPIVHASPRDLDLDELSETLFPVHRQPFSEEDNWAVLSEVEREAWTFAHEEFPSQSTVEDILPLINQAKTRKLSLPITIKIVAAENTRVNEDKVRRYAKLMRVRGRHIQLKFRVLSTKPELYSAVQSVSEPEAEKHISAILEHDAASSGVIDVLYVVLSSSGVGASEALSRFHGHPPIIGGSRVSWIVLPIEKDSEVNVAKILVKTEVAAEKAFIPIPLFFPVAVSPILRISISAYTPGYDQEAPWVTSFPWSSFEKTIRKISLVGQTVGFFVNPSNKECWKCEDVFENVAKMSSEAFTRALSSWKSAQKSTDAETDTGEPEIVSSDQRSVAYVYILVVDVSKRKSPTAVSRFEKLGMGSIEGASMIVINSMESNFVGRLHSLLIQAVAGSAFGVSNPSRYIVHDESMMFSPSAQTNRAAVLLSDIALRNSLLSIVHNQLSQFDTILRAMQRYEVDPAQVLTNKEYTDFFQRANLFLFKVRESNRALSEHRDDAKALHLSESGYHDLKAIKTAFHLQSSKTGILEHFRDPRSKCHFSKIHERAVEASEILEDQNSFLSRLGFVVVTFIVCFMLGRVASLIRGKVKGNEKRE